MPNVDELQIEIKAEAKSASSAIESLVRNLQGLSTALSGFSVNSSYVANLNNLSSGLRNVASSVSGISTAKIKEVSSSLNTLSRTAKSLSTTDTSWFGSIAQGIQSLSGVSIPDFSNITALANGVNQLGYQSSQTAAVVLPQIADALRSFSTVSVPNLQGLSDLATGVRALGSKAIQNAAYALPFVADGLRQFEGLHIPDLSNLTSLAESISAFGRKSATAAITNIPQLADAFRRMMSSLSNMPQVSQNTIDAANAFAHLAAQGGKASSAVAALTPIMNSWSAAADKSKKSAFSLAAAIGKIYASYWILFRVFGKFKESIDLASQLTEVQNVVDVTFGNMSNKVEEFADTSIREFGMSELSAKQFASRFQAMGSAMGISDTQVRKATESLGNMGVSYGNLAESISDVSINLTKLTADIASFYDKSQEEVAEDLQSIFTGMTRPLREYGLDLTQATLKEWAMKNGLDADIQSMSQAEKTMLRYQYVLANTTNAQGDFARTADTWANSLRTIRQQIQKLGTVIGQGFINMFKPALNGLKNFLNTMIDLVEKAFNAIGKLLGWQMEISEVGVSMEDGAEGAGDLADGLGDAAGNAKKLKEQLSVLPFDQLNKLQALNDNDGSGGGSGSGASDGGGGKGNATGGGVRFIPYESDIESWWELGNKIAKTIADALWNIDWNDIKLAAKEIAENLANFINGFIDEDRFWTGIGHTIAEGLNTALTFANQFLKMVKWAKFGQQIGNLINQAVKDFDWHLLGETIANGLNAAVDFILNLGKTFDAQKLGEGIAESISTFFRTFNFGNLAAVLNTWVDNLEKAIYGFVKKMDWKAVFKGLFDFFSNLELDTVAIIIGAKALKFLFSGKSEALEMLYKSIFGSKVVSGIAATGAKIALGVTLLITIIGISILAGKAIGRKLLDEMADELDAKRLSDDEFEKWVDFKFKVNPEWEAFKKGFEESTGIFKVFGGIIEATRARLDIFSADLNQLAENGSGWMARIAQTIQPVVNGLGKLFGATGEYATELQQAYTNSKAFEFALEALTEAPYGPTHSLDSFVVAMHKAGEAATEGMGELHNQFASLADSRNEIESTISTIDGISVAMSVQSSLTQTEIDQLGDSFSQLSQQLSDYIASSYDFIIAQTLADMNYLDAEGKLTDDLKQEYAERIANLQIQKSDAITAADEITKSSNDLLKAYQDAVSTYGKDSAEAADAYNKLKEANVNLIDLSRQYADVTDDVDSSVKNATDSIEKYANSLDLSGENISSFEELGDKVGSTLDGMNSEFEAASSVLEQSKEDYAEYVRAHSESDAEAEAEIERHNAVVDDKLNTLKESYTTNLNDIRDDIVGKIPEMIKAMEEQGIPADVIKEQMDEFVEQVFGEEDGMQGKIQSAIDNAGITLPENAKAMAQNVVNEALGMSADYETAGAALDSGISGKYQSTFSNTEESATGFFGTISNIFNNIRDALTGSTDETQQATSDNFNTMQQNASQSATQTKQSFAQMQKGVTQSVTTMNNDVNGKFANISNNVQSKTSTAKAQATSNFTQLKSNASSIMSSLVGNVGQNLQTMVGKFQSIDLVSIGSNVLQGFWNGMQAVAGALLSWAQGFASQIAATFASAMQIGSPSKLFEQFGEWTLEGYMIGLEKEAPKAKRLISGVGDLISDEYKSSIQIPNTPSFNIQADMQGLADYIVQGVSDVLEMSERNQNVTVYSTLKLENDEVLARAVTRGQENLDYRYKVAGA